MHILTQALNRELPIQKTLAALEAGRSPALISGTGPIHRAHIAASLRAFTGRSVVVVCAEEGEARKMAGDIHAFCGEDAVYLPARDWIFRNVDGSSREMEQQKLRALWQLSNGEAAFTVTTPESLMQRTIPKGLLQSAAFELKDGGEYDLDDIVLKLSRAGYTRSLQVEGPGQFALRGGILDFYSPSEPSPVRCEFFGDEIDSMGYFDVSTQRRTEALRRVQLLPAFEALPSLYSGGSKGFAAELERLLRKAQRRKTRHAALEETILQDIERLQNDRPLIAADRYLSLLYFFSTAVEYFPADSVVMLCEPGRLKERGKNWLWQLSEDTASLVERGSLDGSICDFASGWEQVCGSLKDFAVVMADNFTVGEYPLPPRNIETLTAKQLPSYGGSLETAAGDISHHQKHGSGVVVLCGDTRRCEILHQYLSDHGVTPILDPELKQLPAAGECRIAEGSLSAGFEYPESRLVVIPEGQLAGNSFRKKAKKKVSATNRQKLDSFTDLSPGDLVVHQVYGIGRFVGIVKMPVDKVEKDYVKIAFSGTDALYVPATQLDAVSKYIGGGEDKPVKLSKLGGTEWAKTKARAKGAAKEMASQLIQIQARRMKQKGFAFSPDSPWQEEFEGAFAYQETEDQLRSIQEIKQDMEKTVPMDRLLCGDVGYGKTEVAMRAIMKCIMDGKQAAILVPTTVLAAQHYQTCMSRFSGYPVRIDMLSRFRTPSQMKAAIKGIEAGSTDIIIGTHRLIQKDIHFHDLGLLVVDEEQRFGVQHKERLKEISGNVDVLTLSATPIPRTLNMALSGLRDMSTLEEPPQDRQPVQTYVLEHDWNLLADAIRRETDRGGQVYYLHNRVESIDRTASRLSAMLEGVNVGVAHGKMDEESLASVMEQMSTGELQVLVCTTIIETGIDIPNVNTLIIEDADKLGLAQLHQIRGRVGRSSRRAYAYFTFRRGKVLTEIAEKRLSAIREFAEFNSGFKIAMRDLEIRGAGNLLGAEQSGHILNVGFDMYLQLLEEAVLEEQGKAPLTKAECSADLTVSAGIPESYVASPELRMDLYRRIAHIRTEEDADDMTDELIDRFGEPPKSVITLIRVAILRGEASQAGITEIVQRQGVLKFKLSEFHMERISALYGRDRYKGKLRIDAGNTPAVSLRLGVGENPVAAAEGFVKDYRALE